MATVRLGNPLNLPPGLRAWYENTVHLDLNIFKVLMMSPGTLRPMLELGAHLMFDIQLPIRLREVAILSATHAAGAPYAWSHHSDIAENIGFTPEQIAELASIDGDLSGFKHDERITIEFARLAVSASEVSECTIERARSTLGDRQMVELLNLIGFYWTLSRISTILRVETEPAQGAALIEATRRIHKEARDSLRG
ncbi:carboxymuconolactone decarboxylase family protein [Streptomyces sp. NPDC058701]|uniref:carboxymuconolactone decarboxylase family protein n=1 Tax=Streptomyces sp. NPDC058701 TaxID=3346608 RepID=UPI0036633D68